MDFKRYFKVLSIFFIIILIIIWIGIRVRYELLNIGFVEENIKEFILGYFTLAALSGTGLTICYTWQTSKEKNLLEVVTKNRAEWVKEMKELFSKYFSEYDKLNNNDDITDLREVRNQISLRLNPNDNIDNYILKDLDALLHKKNEQLRNELETNIKLYLKCEWERIKFETREGLKKYDFEREFKKIKANNKDTIRKSLKLNNKLINFNNKLRLLINKINIK